MAATARALMPSIGLRVGAVGASLTALVYASVGIEVRRGMSTAPLDDARGRRLLLALPVPHPGAERGRPRSRARGHGLRARARAVAPARCSRRPSRRVCCSTRSRRSRCCAPSTRASSTSDRAPARRPGRCAGAVTARNGGPRRRRAGALTPERLYNLSEVSGLACLEPVAWRAPTFRLTLTEARSRPPASCCPSRRSRSWWSSRRRSRRWESPLHRTRSWPVTRLAGWSLTVALDGERGGARRRRGRAALTSGCCSCSPRRRSRSCARALFEVSDWTARSHGVPGHVALAIIPALVSTGWALEACGGRRRGLGPAACAVTAVLSVVTLTAAGVPARAGDRPPAAHAARLLHRLAGLVDRPRRRARDDTEIVSSWASRP